jgi:uncharacterized protein YdaU (DUF1376 family)
MAEFPALPLWTDAYLGDTTHLKTIEHGAYLLLLMTAWRTRDCTLPDDDRLLARYARCQSNQWKRMRPVLSEFFEIKNGFWTQKRLRDERVFVEQVRQRQSEKGKLSARAKALKNNGRHSTTVKSGSTQVATEGQPDFNLPSPSPSPSSEDKESSAAEPLRNDPVKELFELGVSILTNAGLSEERARSLIGKWRKAKGEGDVLTGFIECRNQKISNPVEWLTKRFKSARWVSSGGYEYRGDLDAVIRESERRADWTTHWAAVAERDGAKMAAGASR